MIRDKNELAEHIRDVFTRCPVCRIHQEILLACFSPEDTAPHADKIIDFAVTNEWQVNVRALPTMEIVADFFRPTVRREK